MTRREMETPRKDFPFDVDPAQPVFKQGVTLTANQEKDMAFPTTRVLVVSKMTALGTGAGEISIALGERGDFFDLAPGDKIKLSRFSQVRFRNNTAAPKSFELLHSNDPEFTLENYDRGI